MLKHKLKILKIGFFFILIFIVILLAYNQAYIKYIEKNKQIFRNEMQWQEYRKTLDSDVLEYGFFGDSHTRDAVNPRYINSSFNFATGGKDYVEIYYKIKKVYEQDNVFIKNLVLEIDTHTFSEKLRTDERLFREMNYYSSFIPLKKMSELKNQNIFLIYLLDRLKVIGKGDEIVAFLISPPDLTDIEMGWANYTGNFSKKSESVKQTIVSGRLNHQFILNEEVQGLVDNRSLEYFIRIIKLAEKKGSNIIIIKYPVSKAYDTGIKELNISRKEYYNEVFEKINRTGINYSIFDYYDYFFDHPEYFRNSDHLNYIGATKLTMQIIKDISSVED